MGRLVSVSSPFCHCNMKIVVHSENEQAWLSSHQTSQKTRRGLDLPRGPEFADPGPLVLWDGCHTGCGMAEVFHLPVKNIKVDQS